MIVAGVEITILGRLLYEANRPANLEAIVLLWTVIDLWLTNIVLFTLIYRQVDRGGLEGRAGLWQGYPDFSPRRCSVILRILQSLISLLIIVALGARAIDVLGN